MFTASANYRHYFSCSRYFSCEPNRGLFAPVSKVIPVSSMTTSPGAGAVGMAKVSSPRRQSVQSMQSGLQTSGVTGDRLAADPCICGSLESLSSVSSVTSSASRPRVRLGVSSMSQQGNNTRVS